MAVGEGELVNIPEFLWYGWKLKRSEKLSEKVSILIRGWDMLNYDSFVEGLRKKKIGKFHMFFCFGMQYWVVR